MKQNAGSCSAPISGFADLLAPIQPEAFFAQNWESTPLHIPRGNARFYERLLTNRDIEALISSGDLRFPAIQLARDGGFFPPEAFTRNVRSGDDIFAGVPNLDRIRAEYEAGATISLPALHRAWAPLGALAAAIEESFDHPVHTNAYLTPGNATGFAPHYDTHEVFVLQIEGSKHWYIHQRPLALPHRTQPFELRHHKLAAPILDIELYPGDLLYLPRGFVHTTETADRFSLHVTLGVTVYTWIELLAEWVQAAKAHPALRRALLPGFAHREELAASVALDLRQILEQLLQETDYTALVRSFTGRIRAGRAKSGEIFRSDVRAWPGGKTSPKKP